MYAYYHTELNSVELDHFTGQYVRDNKIKILWSWRVPFDDLTAIRALDDLQMYHAQPNPNLASIKKCYEILKPYKEVKKL